MIETVSKPEIHQERVVEKLKEVLDPCSCMTDNPVSIVDLGLVEDIEIDGPFVHVHLIPTTPMCMYMTQIMDEIEFELLEFDRIEEVEVTENIEDIWRPERMSDDLKKDREDTFGPMLQNPPDTT